MPPTPASTLGASSGGSGKIVFAESAEIVQGLNAGGEGGRGMDQEQRDNVRLRQLGYDQVLGRDYTFWSSLAISTVNIGCLQVGLTSALSVLMWKGEREAD